LAVDVLEQIASTPAEPTPTAAVAVPSASPPRLPDATPEKLIYTIKETAAATGVGRTSIYGAIAEGKLKANKLGRRTLIPASALRAWLGALQEKEAD
jgi:excisionase family DNA binding protein